MQTQSSFLTHDPGTLVVGVDVGGTKIAAGVVDSQGQVYGRVQLSTNSSQSEMTLHTIERAVNNAIQAAGVGSALISGVGLGIPGKVDVEHGNSLAGSTLTMDQALRNVMRATNLPLLEALPMATSVPARSLGLDTELGAILPGYCADLVLLDQNLNVRATIVLGNVVYQATDLLTR